MKKSIVIILFALISLTAFIGSSFMVLDFRDDFTGDYFCNRSCNTLNYNQDSLIIRSDTLTLSVVKLSMDSILEITIGDNTYNVILRDSILYSVPEGGRWSGRFFGADSIAFSVSVTHGPFSCVYSGKLISN